MHSALEQLAASLESGAVEPSLLSAAREEHRELSTRLNELEELLITLVRTGWPWDEEGEPNAILNTARDGFGSAMVEARKLLGLDHQRSRLTRTEPKT